MTASRRAPLVRDGVNHGAGAAPGIGPGQEPVVANPQISLRLSGPEEEEKFLAQQMTLWEPVVQENNIKPD